jgi:AraC-like DNA-binding protein
MRSFLFKISFKGECGFPSFEASEPDMITPDPLAAPPTAGVVCFSDASMKPPERQQGAQAVRARALRVGPLTLFERPGGNLGPECAGLRHRRDDNGDWIFETSALQAAKATIVGRMIRIAREPLPRLSHRDETDPRESAWLVLHIPFAWRPRLSTALARREGAPLTGPAAELLAVLLRETPERLGRMDGREETAVADMIGALIEASLSSGGADVHAPDVAELARQRVSRTIRENIGSARLDARRICALTGLSRSALYRLYEGENGVAAHVRAIRLRLVMNDLLDPGLRSEPISAIAERRGFHCAASFNRTFRRAFGRTPSEARAEALARGALDPMGAAG